MPGYDRTGPNGMGSMTGGARGLCNPAGRGYSQQYAAGRAYGRGMAWRRGGNPDMRRGYGRGVGYYPADYAPAYPVDAKTELETLNAEADSMKNSLEMINERISELETKSQEAPD